MVRSKLDDIVKQIHSDKDLEVKMSVRDLLNMFNFKRRTKFNVAQIDSFLTENKLEVTSDYTACWVDDEITIRHKKRAKSKTAKDFVYRIKILPASNSFPISVKPQDTLKKAITIMQFHNYSQLPVMNGESDVKGVITWELSLPHILYHV